MRDATPRQPDPARAAASGSVASVTVLARRLFALSSIALAAAGLAYLLVPALALGIVGVTSSPESDFLIRTEGVALVFGAVIIWALRDGDVRAHRIGSLALAGYYIGSSVVDLAGFAQGIVGPASVPSAVIRITVGIVCLWAAWRDRRGVSA
jgi:hypothetical protein